MARILTGIQSTGRPHLGNILGAIQPAINLSKQSKNESLFFIADLHSFTTVRDSAQLKNNTYATAAAWLAFGFNTKKNLFYRQSDVTEVCELSWYLNCVAKFNRLQLAHSFKDKIEKINDISAGLFTYPVLMASDILLYDANIVPVGKDQVQHLEITRDLASRFNHIYPKTFILPEHMIDEKVMIIPGTDGQKMSKSYNNVIDIFLSDKKLKKQIMSIKTDSLSIDEPKDPNSCTVFKLYKLLASNEETKILKDKYTAGGIGYGYAKNLLFELICSKYKDQREKFNYYMLNLDLIEQELLDGAVKARKIAASVLSRVRKNIGYK
tara:strand:- start:363 stop:1334 length:972 start_codon:yes stop_codon:yes gene_type:complete